MLNKGLTYKTKFKIVTFLRRTVNKQPYHISFVKYRL